MDTIAGKADPQDGDRIIFTMTVTPLSKDESSEAQNNITAEALGNVLEFFDLELTKQENDGAPQSIGSDNEELIKIVIPFNFSGVNQSSIVVYRYHEDEVDKLEQSPNGDGEYFVVDAAAGTITVYAKKFSTYAVGYTNISSNSGGSGKPSVNYIVNVYNADYGQVSADRETADTGNAVTITAAPDEGFMLSRLAVTDKDGKDVIFARLESGKYSFTMPAGDVNINASFVKIQKYNNCLEDESCPINPFTDTDNKGWYHDGIHYCLDHEYMKGIDTTLFDPDGITTRAQIVTILYRMEGEPDFTNNSSFTDLKAESWYEKAVLWADVKDVVTGYDDTHFGPDDTITREQLATILYRYARYKGMDVSSLADISGYTDADKVSEWAVTGLRWADKAGVVNGRTETELAPLGTATRAEAATMIQRFCENILNE